MLEPVPKSEHVDCDTGLRLLAGRPHFWVEERHTRLAFGAALYPENQYILRGEEIVLIRAAETGEVLTDCFNGSCQLGHDEIDGGGGCGLQIVG
jgi:hypothetical protein